MRTLPIALGFMLFWGCSDAFGQASSGITIESILLTPPALTFTHSHVSTASLANGITLILSELRLTPSAERYPLPMRFGTYPLTPREPAFRSSLPSSAVQYRF